MITPNKTMASILCLMLITVLATVGKSPSFQREASQGSRVMHRLLTSIKNSGYQEHPSNARRSLGLLSGTAKAAKYAGGAIGAAYTKMANIEDAAIAKVKKLGKNACKAAAEAADDVSTAVSDAANDAYQGIQNEISTISVALKLNRAEDWFWPESTPYGDVCRYDNYQGKCGFLSSKYVKNECIACEPLTEALWECLDECYGHRNDGNGDGDIGILACRYTLRESERKQLQKIADATSKHLKEHNVKTTLHTSLLYLQAIIDNAYVCSFCTKCDELVRCVDCDGEGEVPGALFGTNRCEGCHGTGIDIGSCEYSYEDCQYCGNEGQGWKK